MPSIDGNECFKWNLGRYLLAADLKQVRITKAVKVFPKKLEFKDIRFSSQS